ncbi:MAG: riboflavin transporter [Thermoproteota archaeon]|nr:riboflavin transporter [Thermoproteota archaeon]
MNTQKIAVIAVFTAISIALVISPAKIPFPLLPFLKYQIWEIPIVAAFLLYGPSVGFSISIMNTLVLLIVYPGDLPTGPLYNLAALASTLIGIYIIQRFANRFIKHQLITVVLSTALGSILRVGVMTVVNWVFLPFPFPIGYNLPAEAVVPLLPIIGLFNATLVFYTIPIGYAISRAVGLSTNTLRWNVKGTPVK